MSVDLSRRQTRVSQEFLDHPQVRPPVEQVRGEGVAQGVRVGRSRSDQRSTIRLTSLVPRRLPLRFRKTASAGVSSATSTLLGPSSQAVTDSAQRSCIGHHALLVALADDRDGPTGQVRGHRCRARRVRPLAGRSRRGARARRGPVQRMHPPSPSGSDPLPGPCHVEERRDLRPVEHPGQAGLARRRTQPTSRVDLELSGPGRARRSSTAGRPPCVRSTPSRTAGWPGTRGSACRMRCPPGSGPAAPPLSAHSTKPELRR